MVIDHQGHYYAEVQGSPIPLLQKFLRFEFFDIFGKKLNRFSKKKLQLKPICNYCVG